ncbi:MAG: efflux RND transporter periplasmic adaptor subunit [Opitutaceae bacterium]
MKDRQTALRMALGANVILAGLVAGLWWHFRPAASEAKAGRPAELKLAAASASDAPSPAPESSEPPLAPVEFSPRRLQLIGVKIGEVREKAVDDEIRTTGNVVVDESRVAYVQTRFSGYIQKVFADSTYQYVRRGQPLLTIYSPDLVATEREYLAARRDQREVAQSPVPGVAAAAASLVDAAAERLAQWNVPKKEIERLQRSRRVRQDIDVDSPASGYIVEREAFPNRYSRPDTRLYTVADLSTIWVFAQVFQSDLGRLKVGDPAVVTVDAYPGRIFSGRVDLIYPDVDLATRTARVRLVVPNPGLKLMPGMFVEVRLRVSMGRHVVIPAGGVLQTGTRQIAFVDAGGGAFDPREIELGERAGDEFIVLKGLKPGERIATSANFLIDSESQLQAALGTFTPPPAGAGEAAAMNTARAKLDLSTRPDPPRKGSDTVRVKLTGANGAPVSGAVVSVTFYMPAMPAMGMAAMREVVTLGDMGNGRYEGGVRLESGGTWQVTILARKDGRVVAGRQVAVHAEGGM